MTRFRKIFFVIFCFLVCFSITTAQEINSNHNLEPDYYLVKDGEEVPQFFEHSEEILKAKVLEIIEQGEREIYGTNTNTFYQILSVEILEGNRKGSVVEIENDYILFQQGEKFFLKHITDASSDTYIVYDADRNFALYFFIILFVLVVVAFGGKQGFRSLLSLIGSLLIIAYLFLPGILAGFSPLLISIIFSVFILIFSIFLTHGLNKKSTVAILGAGVSIIFTGLLAKFAIYLSILTGFASDASVYLNFVTEGGLNFEGLLLGAIIIGVLGILDDVAITQSSCVCEIEKLSPNLSKKEVYRKALNVGKDHVGALINTLALAYVGAMLPLLLLFYHSEIGM
ncbi:MAG: YibE/F family protein, partial [Candidatus Marinimicrobia bacterium]|nr:YibE/F family protein [Candidatus Neomarinimicrobiota bacterium]